MFFLILFVLSVGTIYSQSLDIEQNQTIKLNQNVISFSNSSNSNYSLASYYKHSSKFRYTFRKVTTGTNNLVIELVQIEKGIKFNDSLNLYINKRFIKEYSRNVDNIISDTIENLGSSSKYYINLKTLIQDNSIEEDTLMWTLASEVGLINLDFSIVKIKKDLFFKFSQINLIDSCKGYLIIETDIKRNVTIPKNRTEYKKGDSISNGNYVYDLILTNDSLHKIKDPYSSQNKKYSLIPFNRNKLSTETYNYTYLPKHTIGMNKKIPFVSDFLKIVLLSVIIYMFYFYQKMS